MERVHEVLHHWVQDTPDALAILEPTGNRVTFEQLSKMIDAATDILQNGGVKAGDRVVILTENSVSTVAFIFAASRLDAWICPINARMTLSEVERILDHAQPRALVCTIDSSENAAEAAEAFDAKTLSGPFGEIAVCFPYESSPEAAEDGADHVAVLLYTTGTTGAPKGVMLTHANLLYTCKSSSQSRGIEPGDLVYSVLPMSHIFGLVSSMYATLYAGGSLLIESRFQVERLYKALQEGVTVLPAVPQMHAHLMKHAHAKGVTKLEGTKLKQVSSGAAPLDPTWKAQAEEFYGIALQNGYGMTEATAGICMTRAEKGDPDVSVGIPFPEVEVKLDIQDDGDVGEIIIRGPNVMKGYYKKPEETANTLSTDGWLRTGDLGRFDERERLHVVGRCKELIIRSGFNVFPLEVEKAINDHPDVVQSAVVGRPVKGNEEVLAFAQVTPTSSITEDDLMAHAAKVLTNYKRPSRVIVTQSLPAAATGKILKHKLLETFAAELGE